MLAVILQAQVVQYPIVNQVRLNPPSTTYLTDLVTPNTNRFELTLIQNDFNESEYDIRLKISIEGAGISLVTSPNFQPAPITLNPGATLFTGSELEDYFNPANMIISGIDPVELLESGSGLPEGLYTICVETFDYIQPTIALSLPQCQVKNFIKNYPPVVVFPSCGSTVNTNNQNVLFQWQSQADPFIDVQYNLKIVEFPEGINPNDAINGTGLPLFDDAISMGTNYNYGTDNLPFEVGKRYAYRIQAEDVNGETTFENEGFTEVCTFFYGASPDTDVPLTSPEPFTSLRVADQVVFSWLRPLELPADMPLYYQLKVVRISSGQAAEDAMRFNNPVYDETTQIAPGGGLLPMPASISDEMASQKAFAWQVTAFTNVEGAPLQVGSSEVRQFTSKPSVEFIKTGNPTDNQRAITILGLTKDEDVSNLGPGEAARKIISGAGRIPIDNEGTEVEITFSNITVGKYADDWQLVEGRIDSPLSYVIPLDNSGENGGTDVDFNGHAEFQTTAIIVEVDDLKLRGQVNWFLPHAAENTDIPVVKSIEKEFLFNYYNFVDNYIDIEQISFDLLDPAGFTLKFDGGTSGENGQEGETQFSIVDREVTLRLKGELITPADVTDIENNRVAYSFTDADNPYYFTATNAQADGDIRAVENSTIQLDGKSLTFDLSETESPEGIAEVDWKGVFFNTFDVRFPTNFDESKQLTFDSEQNYSFTQNAETRAWVDGGGLDLKIEKHFSDNEAPTAAFNTFKDDVKDIILDIENNSVNSNSVFKGYVFIPVLSPTEHFNYTIAVGQTGLQVSFLEDALVNRTFTFNEGNDMKIVATVKQAIFRNNERLDLTVDLDWSYIQVELFNVTGLKVWGNGDFGFGEANGFKGLSVVKEGLVAGAYEVAIDSIGAGMFEGHYAFNFVGSMKVGDTQSGIGGTTNGSGAKFNIISEELRDLQENWKEIAVDSLQSQGRSRLNKWLENTLNSDMKFSEDGKPNFFFPIYIRSSVVKAKGHILIMYDDEDWGNAFYGVIAAEIKQPKTFNLDAKVLIGKKDETSYWFVELGIGSGDKEEKTDPKGNKVATAKSRPKSKVTYKGGSIGAAASASGVADAAANGGPNKNPKTKTSIKLGKVEITEVRGRVYYHMSRDMLKGVKGKDCEIKGMVNQVPLGAQIPEGNIELRLPNWSDLSLPQIRLSIDWLSLPDLKKLLCNATRAGFKAILGTLPEPDFTYLNSKSPSTDWVQIETKFPDVTYTQLELMFPGLEWCEIIAEIPGINWSELIFDLNLVNQFPDLCEMTQYMLNKTFDEIQKQQPPSQVYFFENNILSPEEWVTLETSGPDITWRKAYELFPDNNWCELMVALPGIDWPAIWLEIGIPSLQFDFMAWLKEFLKIDFPKFDFDFDLDLPSLPDIDLDPVLDLALTELDMDYKVDASTLFGAMIMVRLQDTPTSGQTVMGAGQLEFSVNSSGGLDEIFLKLEGGGLNPENPTDTKESMIKMLGCFHYGTASKTFTAKVRVSAQEVVCAQAVVDLLISPNRIKIDIGAKEFPIMMQPGCSGWGALGWFNVDYIVEPETVDFGVGLGLTYSVNLETEKYDFGICNDVYGYFKAGAQIAVYGEAQMVADEFKMKKAGVTFGANVSIGVAGSGTLCPFSNITIASAYLGGDLEYNFENNKLKGEVAGQITVIGISKSVSASMDTTIEM